MADDDASGGSRPKRKGMTSRKLLLEIGITLLAFGGFWFLFMRPMQERKKLRETGIRAHGRILDVETTGTYYNKSPELELTLEFRRLDGVLDTATSYFVPKKRFLHMYHPGAAVTVSYDSTDPSRVTVAKILDENSVNPALHGATHGAARADVDSLRRAVDSLKSAVDSLRQEVDSVRKVMGR